MYVFSCSCFVKAIYVLGGMLVALKLLLVYSLLMSNPPIFKYLVLLIETIGQLVMLCFGYWPFFCSG